MDEVYTAAVVGGCGTWGRYYLRAYAAHPRCRLVALVDRARDRREAFAARYGVERVYDDVADLLGAGPPDLVSISLPVAANPAAVMALARGGVRAISCEKPIAVELAAADEMVRVCRERGVPLGCGTACWELPHLLDTVKWVRDGNIGRLTGAAIPGGLPVEVSGAGCVQLTMMRLLTGMEVEWVEGGVEPADPSFTAPAGAPPWEIDGPAYGRLGLTGGIVCEVPPALAGRGARCKVSVEGEAGRVRLGNPSVHVVGAGAEARPVDPGFAPQAVDGGFFTPAIWRLITALEVGGEALCSGHDYRQALEIAIALKLSAHQEHRRIALPLADRHRRLYPHPYRLHGGDVSGWAGGGYQGPPGVV